MVTVKAKRRLIDGGIADGGVGVRPEVQTQVILALRCAVHPVVLNRRIIRIIAAGTDTDEVGAGGQLHGQL